MLPQLIEKESALKDLLAQPSDALVKMMKEIEGDILILGIGGKIGPTLGRMAINAIHEAGVDKRVTGVSRFSNQQLKEELEEYGIKTITCDLLDEEAVQSLPMEKNVIFMAGRKFGTQGNQPLTWAMNNIVPANVARNFPESRMVVFSTGCVYPFVDNSRGGYTEQDIPDPVGEYSNSCLGRERIFEYYSNLNHTPICILRLNYAIDLRYGVLCDIASRIWNDNPVDITVPRFNVIWQGDAAKQTLLSLQQAKSPSNILNITGPENLFTREVALKMGELLEKEVRFAGEEGEKALLNNAQRAAELFGYPSVPVSKMIQWTAHWIRIGGVLWDKPTHFEVNDGRY